MKKVFTLSILVLLGIITISQIVPKPPIALKQPINEKNFLPEPPPPPPPPPNPPAPPVPPAAPISATEKASVIEPPPPPPPPPPTKMYRR